MPNKYICALDIGSSKIAAVVARLKRNRITAIFSENALSRGIKEGTVIDSIELIASIGGLLKKLKAKSGINIRTVFSNISSHDMVARHSHAIIPLAERGNKVITLSDLNRVNQQARILGSSLEEEIIYQIPFSYKIDTKSDILNPLGLYSHKLEVDLYLICAKLSSVQTLSRVINQAGYELKGLLLSGLTASGIVFNPALKTGLNIFCDIGSDTTEMFVFKDGLLRDIKVCPFGGDLLTSELSKGLQIPLDLAEDLKRAHTSIGDYERLPQDKEILVKKGNIYKPIKQRLACEIITAKAKFIAENLKNALRDTVSLNEVDNFICAGRTVLLEGFLEMLEAALAVPVRLARVRHPEITAFINENEALTGQKYLTYLTSLGMICQALQQEAPRVVPTHQHIRNPILKAVNKIKEVYQEYF
ncbi:MAG: cell division protein FtsA [Candidatus Omnitrophota bacterium]|jgi:cell division protein FtsA